MEKRQYSLLLVIAFLIVSTAVGVFAVYSDNSQKIKDSYAENIPVPKLAASSPIPTLSTVNKTEVVSPDGKNSLILKSIADGQTTNWSLTLIDEVSVGTELYRVDLNTQDKIELPANAFSPTNKYVFIKKTESGQVNNLVFKSDGSSFADAKYLDLNADFYKKYQNYKITDVTGWGGYTLIVVNTDKLDGSLGPSFWYDVTSKGFIQLSTRFN